MTEVLTHEKLDEADRLNVMVVDSGNRGEAMAWKLAQAQRIGSIITVPYTGADSLDVMTEVALTESIDIAAICQDKALANGAADRLRSVGVSTFGPGRDAARLEADKEHFKETAHEVGVPTTDYVAFSKDEAVEAVDFLKHCIYPKVVKDIHLAEGKGVAVCEDEAAARAAVQAMFAQQYSNRGQRLIIEDYADGAEGSNHAWMSGGQYKPFPLAVDHKQLLRLDRGPMTGGMGVITPAPGTTMADAAKAAETFIGPYMPYFEDEAGVSFPGNKGRWGLEMNVRPGDPEWQAYMRNLDSDLLEILVACINRRLAAQAITWNNQHAICVVGAAEGYPETKPQGGQRITGLEVAASMDSVVLFTAGVDTIDGAHYSNGVGRILNVTAVGDTQQQAYDRAYAAMERIRINGNPMVYRNDIGLRAS